MLKRFFKTDTVGSPVLFFICMGTIVLMTVLLLIPIDNTQSRITRYQAGACVGGSSRAAKQLKINWAIYLADEKIAGDTKVAGNQRAIRSAEAATILVNVDAQAKDRIAVRFAHTLPPRLAVIVVRNNFHCPNP